MNFVLPVLSAIARRAKANFVAKTRQMDAVQERFLLELLRAHQDTELGRQFGLPEIHTIDIFRERVPILPYSSYAPYTERIAKGEANVLNPDSVVYTNLTSGSTGSQKKVPVTKRFHKSLISANLASIGFCLDALSARKLQFGKLLVTNSTNIQGRTSGGIEYGPVTVGSLRRGKLLYQYVLANSYDTLAIAESVSRHYVCLLFALGDSGVRSLVANFPMLVLRTCGYLEKYAPELINDLKTGTIAPWVQLQPELRAKLERKLRPNPKRARELQEILQSEERLTPRLAWPQLSFVTSAFGGTSDFYFERFPDYFGDIPRFGGIFGTAEGHFGIYHDFNNEGSILAIDSGFFEFIPEEEWEAEQPKTVMPSEVKTGRRYRILVTSYSGFYRYDIGDVVEVLGFYERTPIIVFRHRRGGLLSSTTEKTTEFHVTQAMRALCQEFQVELDDFCIALSGDEVPGRYLVNVELAAGARLDNPKAFLERFDYWLAEYNNPYGTVRGSEVPPPRLQILAAGSFAVVRRRQVEKGMSDSQLKFPHISEDRKLLSGLTVVEEIGL